MGFSLFAQTTGQLAGRVIDARGDAVPFANVILHGTEIGAQTDERGRFIIINITPGVYNVFASVVGFTPHITENVRISVGETRNLTITLQRGSVELDAERVVAEEVLIHRERTFSGTSMNADQILDVVVSDIEGLISLTAGVSRAADGSLNVRGGRANEVVFTIDGMSVSDPVDGGRALSIDLDAIADMKVMTGGFTAEFGNAQSGMINIVTKDGTENWEGKIEGITDHLFSQGSNYDEIKFALGGPIPVYFFNPDLRKKFTFFLNGAAAWDDTRFRRHFVSDPTNVFAYNNITLLDAEYDVYNPYQGRDKIFGFEIGNRNNNSYNINLKTTYVASLTQKFTLAFRGDRNYNTPFAHSWRHALQHYAESDTRQGQFIFTYDHVFDARRTLQVKGSFYQKTENSKPRGVDLNNYMFLKPNWNSPVIGDFGHLGNEIPQWMVWAIDGEDIWETVRYQGVHRDFDSVELWVYNINILPRPRSLTGFFNAPGTIWDNIIDDTSRQYSVRADYEYQISQIVGMKTGFEIIQHDIQKNQLFSFLNVNPLLERQYLRNFGTEVDRFPSKDNADDPDFDVIIYTVEDYLAAARAASGIRDGYRAKPMQFAYYAQTKIDWEGMIVNAGLRLDMWYLGTDYDILQEDGSFRKRSFNSSDRLQLMLSPRLGVSHPISERDVIHFSYNYQNQLPPMRYIFTSRDEVDALTQSGITVGNPALEPQITITYEVGLQHLLTDDYVVGITTYYKNFYNYVSTRKVRHVSEAAVEWYEYISEDYGSARGVDFTLNRRMHNFIAGGLSYSIAWAYGNNSSTIIQDEQTSLREFPLDWDIRHQFNINAIFRVNRGEEFMVPFTSWILPFSDFSVGMNYNIASGRPYTPLADNGNRLETNSNRMPYTQNADLRFTKNFRVNNNNSIRTFLTIENVFKARNVHYVYGRTGSPYFSGIDRGEANFGGMTFPESDVVVSLAERNPSFTNNNRNFIFGISYNF
jgi:outer membrane receptor protein involved in Fe transport